MPRLSRDVVAAREALATKLFGEGKSADDVQKALQAGWNGMKMAPGRLAEIQENVAKGGVISPAPTGAVTLVNPLSQDVPLTIDMNGETSSVSEASPPAPQPAPDVPENPKKFNPAADGFLDFCRAKAKADGMLIVDVSEELYEAWLASKG